MSLFPSFYSSLANWPWLRISPHSSLNVIYCLILTAWQWLMSFTCIPVQIEPNKSPLRKRLVALLLWEIGHLFSPSRSCLGRLILICGGQGLGGSAGGDPPHLTIWFHQLRWKGLWMEQVWRKKSGVPFRICSITYIYSFISHPSGNVEKAPGYMWV